MDTATGSMDRVKTPSLPALRMAVLTTLLAGAAGVARSEVQMAADVGVGRTDNLGRTASDQQSQTMTSVGVQFAVAEQTRRLNADAVGDLSWLEYSDSEFSDEFVGNAAGRVRLSLIPGRLQWVAEDRFGQTRQDLFAAPSPLNRENINHFSTGPDLRLGLGSATELTLGARYSLVDYEHSEADMRRWSASAGLSRELSGTARLSGNVSGESIEGRRGNPGADYDRGAVFLRYALTGSRTTLSMDGGANRVKGGGIEGTGALVRFTLGREVGRSIFSLSAGQEYTDAGSAFGLGDDSLPLPDSGVGANEQSARPYTDRYVRAGWEITGRRTRIHVGAEWSDQNYEEAGAIDVRRGSLNFDISRQVGPRTTLEARVRHQLYDYELGPDNQESVFGLSANWSLARRIGLRLEGEHSVFDADLAPTVRETRYWVRLRYGSQVTR